MVSGSQRFDLQGGVAVQVGSLCSDRPWFPGVRERAQMVARELPSWAIASGITAGWVWTGFGDPEPWHVVREATPGISPLARTVWKATLRHPVLHSVHELGDLCLLEPRSAAFAIAHSTAGIDLSATQILMMRLPDTRWMAAGHRLRLAAPSRLHAKEVLNRVKELHARYPDITR